MVIRSYSSLIAKLGIYQLKLKNTSSQLLMITFGFQAMKGKAVVE